jgi:hypothetical protein
MPANVGVALSAEADTLGIEKKEGIFENMVSPWVFKKEAQAKMKAFERKKCFILMLHY